MSNVFTCTATVVRDAERRYLPSGQAVLNVTVANNQGFNDKQTTLFIRCAVWGKKAESTLIDYLKKGQQVLISGELTQSEYKAQDGTTKTSLELNCNILDLVGKRAEGGQQAAPQQQRPAQKAPSQDNFGAMDEDIPFMRIQHEMVW